jgi:hypothetical protein
MNTQRLFKNVWRINAIIIFAAGLLAIAVLVFAAYEISKDIFREREVRAVVNTNDSAIIQESLALGQATEVHGHPWLLAPIESDQKYDQSYYSKAAVAVRNYVFISGEGNSRWLFPHNRFLISEESQLRNGEYIDEKIPTLAVSFLVRQSDTNNDNRITGTDLGVLVFTRPDGSQAKEAIHEIKRVISQRVRGENILVLYESTKEVYAATVSLKDFEIIRREPIVFPGSGS